MPIRRPSGSATHISLSPHGSHRGGRTTVAPRSSKVLYAAARSRTWIHSRIRSSGAASDGEGAVRAMNWAMEDAGVTPEEVDYISAHGTSTKMNDSAETLSIKKTFGEQAYRIPISATKSMIGHSFGAAGALESVACLEGMRHGVIHPTINYEHPDPECDLDYVPNEARRADVRVALKNSFGFGGQNACLLFERFED